GASGATGTQGPKGDTGATGAQGNPGIQGDTGATGPAGPQGIAGAQGIQGPTGTAATVNVGTTTTGTAGSNAAVTNTGTSSAAVFNFTVPQGIQGTAGTPGTAGAQGPAGPAGPTAVSTDSGNLATLGSDSLLYLPPSAVQPTIWSVRLRSFNAVGNPNFEVDQRNAGSVLTNAINSIFLQDRYQLNKVGTMTVNGGQNAE